MAKCKQRGLWLGVFMMVTAVAFFVKSRFTVSNPSRADTPSGEEYAVDTRSLRTTSLYRNSSSATDGMASGSDMHTPLTGIEHQVKCDVIDTSRLNKWAGHKLLSDLNIAGKLDFRRVARLAVPNEWLTPMEREILRDKPTLSLDSVAAPYKSSFLLISPGQNEKVKVGDNVTVRVDLKDARGRSVRKGGHSVRVWMVQNHGGHHRSLAADVMDMRNGSYVASLPVLWEGTILVRAAMVRSREFHHVMLTLKNTMKMTNQNVGAFVSGNTEQVTLCSFVPAVPGFLEVCDLTEANSGLPWYCGQPNKTGLTCDHWSSTSHTPFPLRYGPASEVDNLLIKSCNHGPKDAWLGLLPRIVNFTSVKGKLPAAFANKNCTPLQPRDSWTDQSPRGFWEGEEWHPLISCPLPRLDEKILAKCFQHTRLISLGDSNVLRVQQYLEPLLNCTRQEDGPDMRHAPRFFVCPLSNTTLAWYPHAFPFFTGKGSWSSTRAKHAPSVILDTLPNTGRYVVLLHLYLHFAPMHISVYALHVRDTARAVRDLLTRNPEVKVIVRGPHAVVGGRFQLSSDLFTEQCLRILKHEFRALRERVMLLNMWDMTVANRNYPIHPDTYVTTTLIRMMLAHVCPALK